jgi:hypothetical protein
VYFAFSASDPDGDPLTYYLYINGTYNDSTTATSLVVNEFDAGNYEYVLFAWDGYTNGTNSTIDYFNIDNVPGAPTVTAPNSHNKTANHSVYFAFSASDPDGDPLRYYLYINGTYNDSTTSTSLVVNEFDAGNYEYVLFAWDGYTNGTNSNRS